MRSNVSAVVKSTESSPVQLLQTREDDGSFAHMCGICVLLVALELAWIAHVSLQCLSNSIAQDAWLWYPGLLKHGLNVLPWEDLCKQLQDCSCMHGFLQ